MFLIVIRIFYELLVNDVEQVAYTKWISRTSVGTYSNFGLYIFLIYWLMIVYSLHTMKNHVHETHPTLQLELKTYSNKPML
jgi:hypothetical protein